MAKEILQLSANGATENEIAYYLGEKIVDQEWPACLAYQRASMEILKPRR
jgi:hypothetical protein